jgi:hypothetical protein
MEIQGEDSGGGEPTSVAGGIHERYRLWVRLPVE